MSTNPYSVPYPEQQSGQPGMPQPGRYGPTGPMGGPIARPSRAVQRVLGAIAGLVVTPAAVGLVAYGGTRQQRMFQVSFGAEMDVLSIALMVGGGILLIAVGALGALSSLSPLVGGVVWGVIPGLISIVSPRTAFDLFGDLLGGGEFMFGLLNWLIMGSLFGVGMLLVGTGLACAFIRNRRR